jgi:hypothetical protein
MALIAVAADKGAPGVTTTATALAAVWPQPVVLAECDPAGGDVVYRLPGAHGGRLDPRRGLLSLAVAARHGLEPGQVWQHAQRLRGGLDVLAGVGNAEQGSGIEPLWGPVGDLLARLPGADVIADCGRLGPDGPYYELLARAAIVVLIVRPSLGEVLRLRDRVATVALAVDRRGGHEPRIGVLVVADRRGYRRALAEVRQAVGGADSPVGLVSGIAYEPKSAQRLRGEWGGRLDRSLLIRTARDAAGQLAGEWLPSAHQPSAHQPSAHQPSAVRSSTGPLRTGSAGTGLAGTGPAGAGSRPAGPATGAGPAGAARPAPGARPAGAGWGSGARPAGAARSAGPARPAARVNGHRRHTDAGTQETRAWAPGAREPAARANGRPAAAAAPGSRTADWAAAGPPPATGQSAADWAANGPSPATGQSTTDWAAAGPPPATGQSAADWAANGSAAVPGSAAAVGPRAWDLEQRAHHPEADRPRPPWPDPAWPGPAGPGPEVTWAGPAGSSPDLAAGRVTAARLAADQITAAELTAAQVAAARLGPAEAAGGWPAGAAGSWPAAQSDPLPPGSAQPGRRRGAFRAGTGRGGSRSAGRGTGRGRHAGGPARPAPDPGAAEPPGSGRARPRGW